MAKKYEYNLVAAYGSNGTLTENQFFHAYLAAKDAGRSAE